MMAAPALMTTTPDNTDKPWRIAPERLVIVGLDTRDGPEHPLWDERLSLPIEEAVVLSIMAIGVRVPIEVVVRDGKPLVVDGRQRTRNAREANRRLVLEGEPMLTVPIASTPGTRLSNEMASVISATLNELRVSDPLLVKMRRAKRMLERGLEPPMVATAFGVQAQTLAEWGAVLNACAEVTNGVLTGTISMNAAVELAKLAPEAQPGALAKLLDEPRPSKARAAAVVRSIKTGAPAGARLPPRAVERVLTQADKFPPEFIRGVRFAAGRLSPEEVETIMQHAEKIS
jgi:ParB family transcriptional regulator, chromosome partitioning protein